MRSYHSVKRFYKDRADNFYTISQLQRNSERYKDKKGTFTFCNKVLNLNFRQHQERTQEQIL